MDNSSTPTAWKPEDLCAAIDPAIVEDDPFPIAITSVFGQNVPLISANGNWEQVLRIEHLGYGTQRIPWGDTFNSNPLIEWAARSWGIERFQTRIDLRPFNEFAKALKSLALLAAPNPSWRKSLSEWSRALCLQAIASGNVATVTGAKQFFAWCVNEDLPYFEESLLRDLEDIYIPPHGAKDAVSLLDPVAGPYSLAELSLITGALEQSPELWRHFSLVRLCKEWGLRPIQLALLREEDVGSDSLGPYIDVPRVKGRRGVLRRSVGNFRRRRISPELYEDLKRLMEKNEHTHSANVKQLARLGVCSEDELMALPRPLFPKLKESSRAIRMMRDAALRDYTMHSDSPTLSRMLSDLTAILRLSNSRIGDSSAPLDFIEISAYRFRRTMGTMLVINGATPNEVAEALDHESIATIEHYFRWNRELIDYVSATAARSPEIAAAVEAWGPKVVDMAAGDVEGIPVKDLGICKRNGPCPHHPTISCYGCSSFRPSIDGDHKGAREFIVEFIRDVGPSSTGPIRKQLDDALANSAAVIKAVDWARNGR